MELKRMNNSVSRVLLAVDIMGLINVNSSYARMDCMPEMVKGEDTIQPNMTGKGQPFYL